MKKWKSFNGKSKSIEELDQQHLSNIYWFNTLINLRNIDWSREILEQIDKRFNGEILEYRPLWGFNEERNYLENSGYLKWNEDKTSADIVALGKKVGILEHPSVIRDIKLDEILNK